MTRLSEHFTLEEFTRNSHGLENQPNKQQIDNLVELCERVLEPLRRRFFKPIVITSGFRSPELNMLVGGVDTSQHSKGEAADIHIVGVANQVTWKYINANLEFDQLIAEKLSERDGLAGWVHVSYSSKKNRKDAISFLGNNKYVKGLQFIK